MLRAEATHFSSPLSLLRSSSAGKLKSVPSSIPKDLLLLSRSFDDNFLQRLKSLNPPSLSFPWLARAVRLLAATQADAADVVGIRLRQLLPGQEKVPLAWYLDGSVKVLDICNSVASEIENLTQGRLLVHFLVRVLDGSESISPDDLRRARECMVNIGERCFAGGRSRNAAGLLRELTRSLDEYCRRPPRRGKIEAVERILYAVQAATAFVLGVVVAVLEGGSGSAVPVPGQWGFSWDAEFHGLQSAVQSEIRRRLAGDRKRVLFIDEIEALEERLGSVSDVLLGREDDDEEARAESVRGAVRRLQRTSEEMSDGLDDLSNGVNGLFRQVLSTRSVFLEQFREEC